MILGERPRTLRKFLRDAVEQYLARNQSIVWDRLTHQQK
jgi:hypothetical protein